MTTFNRLLTPFNVKNVTLPNRIVFPATVTNYGLDNGAVSEPLIDYYKTISRNRIGLTIVGATAVSAEGALFVYCTRLDSDEYVDGFSKLFQAIKDAGSVPAIQIAHAGRQTSIKMTGLQPVAPSAIPCPVWQEMPRELNPKEIETIEDQFAETALRAKQAGAELVELHAAHGYLINQFLSPHTNRRTDHYGGSFENRARIVVNMLAKIREKVGDDFPLLCRISAEEFVEGGLTLTESKEIAGVLVENGVDIINVSGGISESRPARDKAMEEGRLLELAKGIKEAVSVPVIAVGKILDLNQAEQVLNDGVADLVAICRAIIADPQFVPKTLENRRAEIQECSECGGCLASLMEDDMRLRCSVNEEWGRLFS